MNLPNPFKTKKELNKLEQAKILLNEYNQRVLSEGESYYWSEEAKITAKKGRQLLKEYLEENPTDYLTQGSYIYHTDWDHQHNPNRKQDKQICLFLGEGKYFEDKQEYEKAIKLYEKANRLYFQIYGDEIKEMDEFNGVKAGEQITEKRLRITKNKLFKEKIKTLENEAKEKESADPEKAIEIYQKLNTLKPGLKKYNKRIEILERRIKKESGL